MKPDTIVELWNRRGGAPFASMKLSNVAVIYEVPLDHLIASLEKMGECALSEFHYIKVKP